MLINMALLRQTTAPQVLVNCCCITNTRRQATALNPLVSYFYIIDKRCQGTASTRKHPPSTPQVNVVKLQHQIRWSLPVSSGTKVVKIQLQIRQYLHFTSPSNSLVPSFYVTLKFVSTFILRHPQIRQYLHLTSPSNSLVPSFYVTLKCVSPFLLRHPQIRQYLPVTSQTNIVKLHRQLVSSCMLHHI